MNHKTAQKMSVEVKSRRLRQKIEKKRRKLNCNIKGKDDLLRQQKLSRELDRLIGQYWDLKEKELLDV